ncbi:MAG: hypothetical protein A3H96_05595 [Acidobacteria bacterium RIFCSPLOWO2_02_FULL_67_36]|nr:MAG: hypothetical protein A3H96_05595 [Acidobacteria bacterium RIFCSPLOWO2_02_FULL_67_36]OFW25609.1 MAG: hypothetical protein A3G21_05595 [Acidobacteria bacterium RIFCSPLOWO2_12_FULL_66_21]
MTRIIVLGARGFFGAAALACLRDGGARPLAASRRAGADLLMDAEDPRSLRAALHSGDVVVDAAGPFQFRSTVLVESCLSIGCDVVDLADSLDYVRKIHALSDRIASAGCRVLTACSSVSAVSAALIRLSGVIDPLRVSTYLVPATRNTSTPATAQALFASLERPVRLLRAGALVERRAFSDTRRMDFPPPVGRVHARLGESADAVTLPRVWPTLRDVDFWVDTRRRPLNALVAAAARSGLVRSILRAVQPLGRAVTRRLGAKTGGFGIEVEGVNGDRVSAGFVHATHSYVVAVAPAVLAARRIAGGTFGASGLVPPDRQIDARELVDYLRRTGVLSFGLPAGGA